MLNYQRVIPVCFCSHCLTCWFLRWPSRLRTVDLDGALNEARKVAARKPWNGTAELGMPGLWQPTIMAIKYHDMHISSHITSYHITSNLASVFIISLCICNYIYIYNPNYIYKVVLICIDVMAYNRRYETLDVLDVSEKDLGPPKERRLHRENGEKVHRFEG